SPSARLGSSVIAAMWMRGRLPSRPWMIRPRIGRRPGWPRPAPKLWIRQGIRLCGVMRGRRWRTMRALLPHGETVTIVRPGPPTQDEYGNDVPGTPVEIDVPGCGVAPRTSSEITDARDTVIVGLTLYAPAGTDLRATDRVRVGGELY